MSDLTLKALIRAREWMLLDDTYGDAEQFRVDLELVDAAITENSIDSSRIADLENIRKIHGAYSPEGHRAEMELREIKKVKS